MKKLMWVPTICLGLMVSACGTNNDGLQNYATNNTNNPNTNPYRNMNMYDNGGADIYRTHMNSVRGSRAGDNYGDQRTYLLRSGTDSNNQAIYQYSPGRNNVYPGYGSSFNQNAVGNQQSLYGGRNNRGAQGLSSYSDRNNQTSVVGYAQSSKGQSAHAADQVYVDRNLMASYIANLVQGIPYVDRATVLVTDDHVFINVDTKQKNRGDGKAYLKNLHNQVRKQALSVTPRYYKVRVTSNDSSKEQLMKWGSNSNTQQQSTQQIESLMNR